MTFLEVVNSGKKFTRQIVIDRYGDAVWYHNGQYGITKADPPHEPILLSKEDVNATDWITDTSGEDRRFKLWLEEAKAIGELYNMSALDVLKAVILLSYNKHKDVRSLMSWAETHRFVERIQEEDMVGKVPVTF